MEPEYSIKVEELSRKFGSFTAVDRISFQVEKGEIFGFLGANGAGKTTSIKMLTGLLQPTSGNAKVAGFDVYKQADKIKESIGYMSQMFSLYDDLTIMENIRFYGGIYGMGRAEVREKAEQRLNELGLYEQRKKLVRDLPLGWKQKLAFTVSGLHDPPIMFLDEPTSGVDPVTRRQFWDLIYKASHFGTTIFITTHYMEESEYCHRVSIMASGEIKALDQPEKLKEKYEVESMNEVFVSITKADRG